MYLNLVGKGDGECWIVAQAKTAPSISMKNLRSASCSTRQGMARLWHHNMCSTCSAHNVISSLDSFIHELKHWWKRMRCVVSCWGFFRWMWIASGRCWSLAYQMNGHLWLIGVQKKFKQMNESCDKKMVSLFDQNWMANGNLKGGADKIIKINSDVEGSLAVSEGAWGVSLNRGGWWVWLWREAIESVLQQ